MTVFYLCGDVYKFTRNHATLKFHKPSKTTTDYIKYSSTMAENRVCEFFYSVLKNKLNKHATEQSEKLSDLKKPTIKAVLKTINTFGHKLMKSLPGFLVPSLSAKLSKSKFTSLKELCHDLRMCRIFACFFDFLNCPLRGLYNSNERITMRTVNGWLR